jgi:hypothetical protein
MAKFLAWLNSPNRSGWQENLIRRGSIHGNLRVVVEVIESDDPETFAILVVEPQRRENP